MRVPSESVAYAWCSYSFCKEETERLSVWCDNAEGVSTM